jgi:hypothetical protein
MRELCVRRALFCVSGLVFVFLREADEVQN